MNFCFRIFGKAGLEYRTAAKESKTIIPTRENLLQLEDDKNKVFYDAFLEHGYSFKNFEATQRVFFAQFFSILAPK